MCSNEYPDPEWGRDWVEWFPEGCENCDVEISGICRQDPPGACGSWPGRFLGVGWYGGPGIWLEYAKFRRGRKCI